MAQVTKHATQRTKERLGPSTKKAVVRNANRALRYGLRHRDTHGKLHRYIDALYWRHRTANNIRIYQDHVYIFHGGTLITVYSLPEIYRNEVSECFSRKRGDLDDEDLSDMR